MFEQHKVRNREVHITIHKALKLTGLSATQEQKVTKRMKRKFTP